MKAACIYRYGGPEELVIADLPAPVPRPDDVVIAVRAASVNPVDWKIREGRLRQLITYTFPLILGWDAAGEIVDVGPEAAPWQIGDKVFTRPDITRNGTYAELTAVSHTLIARMPQNLSFEEAASIPLAGLTAWEALMEQTAVGPDDIVLIHGAAGGVGGYAVQLAKHIGATVIATTHHHPEYVRALGADTVLDYANPDWMDNPALKKVTVVLDTIGGRTQSDSLALLSPGGRLVSVAAPPDTDTARDLGVDARYFFLQPDGQKLAKLGHLFETGAILPTVSKVFPLEEIRSAHEFSQTGHPAGKIVITVK